MKKIETTYNDIPVTIIETDKFKSVIGSLYFKTPIKKEMMVTRKMIMNLLLHTCKKYPQSKELNKKMMDLYNPSIVANTSREGNYRINRFAFRILDDKYTKDGNMLEAIKLFREIIFNPNVSDNAFDKDEFNLEYQAMKSEIESKIERPKNYALEKLDCQMGEGTPISYVATIEDLNKITSESLYQDYLKMIKESEIELILAGKTDNQDEIIRTVLDGLKTVKYDKELIISSDIKNEVQEEKETYDGKQSILTVGLKLGDISDYERSYVAPIYSGVLGGGASSRLFSVIREKNSLAYSCFSRYEKDDSVIVVSAGIDGKNYEKALSLIKQIVSQMSEVKEEEIERVKKEITSSLKESLDYLNSYPNYVYKAKLYNDTSDIYEKIKEVNKVTLKDITNFSKKVFLTDSFLLEGESSNENNKDKEA